MDEKLKIFLDYLNDLDISHMSNEDLTILEDALERKKTSLRHQHLPGNKFKFSSKKAGD